MPTLLVSIQPAPFQAEEEVRHNSPSRRGWSPRGRRRPGAEAFGMAVEAHARMEIEADHQRLGAQVIDLARVFRKRSRAFALRPHEC